MSLRLIEVVVPEERGREVVELVESREEQEYLGLWTASRGDGLVAVEILARTSRTERLTDRMSERFGDVDGFRLMLLSVEATLPLPDDTPGEEGEAEKDDSEQDAQEAWNRLSREELYQDIAGSARLTTIHLVTVALSTVVAAVGLLRGDTAIIIGAMVIAPLLGPNVALALASTLGDLQLAARAGKTAAAGLALGCGLSLAAGLLVEVDPQVPEILSRTRVSWGDVLLALAAGSAGALAFTTGLPAAVVGVTVAVALLPPLVVVGLLLGAGQVELALGAVVLLITNVTCVNLAGVGTFLAQKIRPRRWWDAERAKKAARTAVLLWLAVLALLLGAIFWLGQADAEKAPEGLEEPARELAR